MTPELILLIIVTILLIIILIKQFSKNNLQDVLNSIASVQNEKLNNISNDVKRIEEAVKKEISFNRIESNNQSARARNELTLALSSFKTDLGETIQQFNSIQKDNFFALLNKQSEQNTDTSTKLDSMRQTIEQKVTAMQQSNEQKLEQMRITVDEKLQQTLEARLGESFKLVSERLEAVHKGLAICSNLPPVLAISNAYSAM